MTPHPRHHDTTRPAAVLLLVLIVLAAVAVLAVGLAYRTRIEIRLVKNFARRTYVHHLALGGIERALAHLTHFPNLPGDQRAKLYCLRADAHTEELFLDLADSDNPPVLAYSIEDELGFLSINRYDANVWAKLTPCLTPTRRDYILNWRSVDACPNPNGEQGDFYADNTPPYRSKNNNFESLRELLYVKTITPEILVGKNTLNQIISPAERSRLASDNETFDESFGLIRLFTAFGDGRVNINTAPSYILALMPQITRSQVDAILAYRAGNDGQLATEDDTVFQNPNDVAEHPQFQSLNLDCFCFTSNYFRLRSFARLKDGTACSLMAAVQRSDDNIIQVLYVETLPTFDD